MSLWGEDNTSFGNSHDLAGYKSAHAPNLALQDAYVRYVVTRLGCFTVVAEVGDEHVSRRALVDLGKV